MSTMPPVAGLQRRGRNVSRASECENPGMKHKSMIVWHEDQSEPWRAECTDCSWTSRSYQLRSSANTVATIHQRLVVCPR